MTLKELNEKKIPVVRIDNTLKKYKDMNLFQDKVDSANEVLKKVGLPKSIQEDFPQYTDSKNSR